MAVKNEQAEEALERAVAILAPFPVGEAAPVEWDFTTEGEFRVPHVFEDQSDAAGWCRKALVYYGESLARDRTASGLSMAQIKQEMFEIKIDLEALANRLEALSIDSYRVIVGSFVPEVLTRGGKKIASNEVFKLIVPIEPDKEGPARSILSEQLHGVAAQLEAAIRPAQRGGLSILARPDKGGRRKIPQALGAPRPAWLLTHLGWELFQHLGRPMPTTAVGGKLNRFLSTLHESATGEIDVSFEGPLKEYRLARVKLGEIGEKLRVMGNRYGWSSFDECQLVLNHQIHPNVPLTKSVRAALRTMANEYLDLRRYLFAGRQFQ